MKTRSHIHAVKEPDAPQCCVPVITSWSGDLQRWQNRQSVYAHKKRKSRLVHPQDIYFLRRKQTCRLQCYLLLETDSKAISSKWVTEVTALAPKKEEEEEEKKKNQLCKTRSRRSPLGTQGVEEFSDTSLSLFAAKHTFFWLYLQPADR